jgi:alkylhydroperoxidase family enzyme
MARLPLVDPETAPERTQKVLAGLPPLKIFRTMAHAENSFVPLLQLGTSILAQQQLDPKLREYAVLQGAKYTRGEYEWVQHVPIAIQCGATQEQLEALERDELDAACFDEVEQLVLAFNREAMQQNQVGDALFAKMRDHFSDREIVELLLTLGYYSMLARMTEVVQLEVDSPDAAKMIGELKSRS